MTWLPSKAPLEVTVSTRKVLRGHNYAIYNINYSITYVGSLSKITTIAHFLMRKLKLRKVNDLLKVTELGIKPRSLRLQSYMHIKSMNTSLIKIIITSILLPSHFSTTFGKMISHPLTHWYSQQPHKGMSKYIIPLLLTDRRLKDLSKATHLINRDGEGHDKSSFLQSTGLVKLIHL